MLGHTELSLGFCLYRPDSLALDPAAAAAQDLAIMNAAACANMVFLFLPYCHSAMNSQFMYSRNYQAL